MQTGAAVSLAALVFSERASPGLGRAASTFLIGGVIASIVCARYGSFSVIVASPKNNVTVVLASIIATFLVDIDGDPVNTVAAFMLTAVAASGVLLYLVGRFEFGNLVRYLPFPVMGGYLGATAWLLFKGGLSVMTGARLTLDSAADLFTSDLARLWVPGVLLVATFGFVKGANKQSMVIVAAIAGFHLGVAAVTSHSRAEELGWVLGPLPESDGIGSLIPSFTDVDWGAIGESTPGIAAAAFIAVIGLLLNITAVGYSVNEEFDINQELRAAGAATAASGIVGGTVGFIGVGQTLLAHRMKASSALVSAACVVMALITILAGPSLIGWMPRLVAGALVMSPAVMLARRWWTQAVLVGSIGDRAIALAIPAVVAIVGVLEGVGFGVAAAAAIFVVRYAAVDPVRSQMSGATARSMIERPIEEQRVLDLRGNEITVIEIVGFLFFGSASKLTDQARHAIEAGARHCLLDFRRVTGVDSSAEAELAKLVGICQAASTQCSFANAPASIRNSSMLGAGEDAANLFYDSVDQALEQAENQVLANDLVDVSGSAPLPSELVEAINEHFHQFVVPAHTELMTAGSNSDAMFMVQSGTCTVWDHAEGDADGPRRIRRIVPGAFVGEMGFFSGRPRSATVRADVELTVLRMTRREFDWLTQQNPHAALKLMREVLTMSSRRLDAANSTIRDLLR